ncbi:MAG: hypothetical protein J6S61_00380 [Elusimicrobiaceae bacterium]|nr:hypothetical protein [Elusimicrobiaceae bacterium]
MKYCFMILTLCVLFCACSYTQEQVDDGYYYNKENGVLEEEFDLLVAPQMDYEKEIPYEDQIKAINEVSGKESVKLAKPQQTQKPQKKSVNAEID